MKTWFKHDYNARNDEKLVNLSMNEGLEGLAIYWCLIEMLYENNGSLDNNCERIAFALHSQKDKINKIINGYSLFKINKKQNIIFCDRVLSQLKEIDNISEKARIGAKVKWNKYYANAKRSQCDRNATAMQIEKRREEKKEKIEKSLQAEPANLINSFLKEFEELNPTLNYGNTTQRKACAELIANFGYKKTIAMLNYYKSIRSQKFSPIITTPYQFQQKIGELINFYNKSTNSQGKTWGDAIKL